MRLSEMQCRSHNVSGDTVHTSSVAGTTEPHVSKSVIRVGQARIAFLSLLLRVCQHQPQRHSLLEASWFASLERGAAYMHLFSGSFCARAMTTSEMATMTRGHDEVRIEHDYNTAGTAMHGTTTYSTPFPIPTLQPMTVEAE